MIFEGFNHPFGGAGFLPSTVGYTGGTYTQEQHVAIGLAQHTTDARLISFANLGDQYSGKWPSGND